VWSAPVETAGTADVDTGGLRRLEEGRLDELCTTDGRAVDPEVELRGAAGGIEDDEYNGEEHASDRGGAGEHRTPTPTSGPGAATSRYATRATVRTLRRDRDPNKEKTGEHKYPPLP
jgi:hypothetical protein